LLCLASAQRTAVHLIEPPSLRKTLWSAPRDGMDDWNAPRALARSMRSWSDGSLSFVMDLSMEESLPVSHRCEAGYFAGDV
jgi:hypothetical protein